MNKIILVGRFVKAPEGYTTANNIPYARFAIACKSRQRDEYGEQQTDFIECVAWRDKAELILKYCTKGSLVQICGSLGSRSYTGRDGTKRTVWEVQVEDVEFLSSKKEAVNETQSKLIELDERDLDDLPF